MCGLIPPEETPLNQAVSNKIQAIQDKREEVKAHQWDESKTPDNALCPCGSKKKFKKCHGRNVVPVQEPPKLVTNKEESTLGKEPLENLIPNHKEEGLEANIEITAASPTAGPLLDAFGVKEEKGMGALPPLIFEVPPEKFGKPKEE